MTITTPSMTTPQRPALIPRAAEARQISRQVLASLDITTLDLWRVIAERMALAREHHGLQSITIDVQAVPPEHLELLVQKLSGLDYVCSGDKASFTIDWHERAPAAAPEAVALRLRS